MSQTNISVEFLYDLFEVIRDGVIYNLFAESQKLSLQDDGSSTIVSHDEEFIWRGIGYLCYLFFAGLHAHGDVILIELFLERQDVRSCEIWGHNIGGMGGRDEMFGHFVIRGLSILFFLYLFLMIFNPCDFHLFSMILNP